MKLKAQQSSTQQQISEQPWVDCPDGFFCSPHQQAILTPPNPPTSEAIEKAQFKDKTYRWNGR